MASEGDRDECIQNWIDDIFGDAPISSETRTRITQEWGELFDRTWVKQNGAINPRSVRFERDYERGKDYFIAQRIKEFAKGESLTPEQAYDKYYGSAENHYNRYQEQLASNIIGGGIGLAHGMRGMYSGRSSSSQASSSAPKINQSTDKLQFETKKFRYLFGESKGNEHNAARSNQLSLDMKRLGIHDNQNGHRVLHDHFRSAISTDTNITQSYTNVYGNFEIRESLLIGPSGKSVKLESTFEIMKDGSRRFITTIPFGGK